MTNPTSAVSAASRWPEGLACDEAGAGPDAIDLAAKATTWCLLDVDLPGYSGERFSAGSGSGRRRRTSRSSCFRRGQRRRVVADHARRRADDFLTKPFSMVQLRALVKAACA